MIIKLTGADFSANNIGKLDVRTEVDSATLAMLNNYGKTSWSLSQKLIINDFLTGFNSSTWKSKVKRLVLPILAPLNILDRNEQGVYFYDIISGTNLTTLYGGAYGSNKMEITANGLKNPNGKTVNDNNDYFGINYNLPSVTLANFHYGVYSYKDPTDQELGQISSSVGGTRQLITESGVTFGFYSTTSNTGDVKGVFDVNTKFKRGLRIASYNGAVMVGMSVGLPLASVSYRNTLPMNQTGFDSALISRYTPPIKTEISLLTIGENLTQSELLEYNNLIETLMESLWTK